MGQCTSMDDDSATWQLSIRRSGVDQEEERLKQLKEEIVEQQRKLDTLNSQVARMSLMIEDKEDSRKDSDISYLMETGNFQTMFPSLSKEELSNLLNVIMLINAHSHSLYSERSNPKSEILWFGRRKKHTFFARFRSAATNTSRDTTASAPILSQPAAPNAEETFASSMSVPKYVTFTERPFGFQIAMPNHVSHEVPILPYVYSVTNKLLRKRGVVAGMALQSVNGEQFLPGSNIEEARQVLQRSSLPATMGFCIPDQLASPARGRRKRSKKKRKRGVTMCEDCHMTIKRRRAKRGLDGKYYCGQCNLAHICKYCNFWSAEVDRNRGYIFCDECLVAERFVTFSAFPLPFSLHPEDDEPVIRDVEKRDAKSLGLSNGWVMTTINEKNVTGQSAYKVISMLARETFPLTLGFKRPANLELGNLK